MNDEKIIEHINNEIFKNVNNKEKKAKPINIVKRIISYAISKRKTKEKQNIK